MSIDTPPPQSFDIGRVFTNTFKAIGANFGVFAILAFLFGVLPQAGFGALALNLMNPVDPSDPVGFFKNLPLIFAGGLVSLFCTSFLQAAIVHGSVDSFNGKKASLAACMSTGARNFLPVLAITLLSALGLMLGFLLLIVPGIILALMWTVAAPVKVVEKNVGIFESFGRSIKLTEGSRLWILLIAVIYGVLSWIVSAIASAIGVGATMAMGGGLESLANAWPLQVVVSPLIEGLGAMVSTAGLAAIYFELRQIKEGVGPASLASVFD